MSVVDQHDLALGPIDRDEVVWRERMPHAEKQPGEVVLDDVAKREADEAVSNDVNSLGGILDRVH